MVELEIDGKKVEVPAGSMVIQAAHKVDTYIPHFCYHKKLSIAANCRMCLVRCRKGAEGRAGVRDAGGGGHDRADQVREGDQGSAVGHGIPADQPSARLPDLRPGRRMPAPGSRGRLRQVVLALQRGKAGGVPQERRPADLDGRDDALHPLHPLRALRPGNRRRHGARHARPRRTLGNHLVRRQLGRLRTVGQYDRPVPGRRADVQAVPLQRPDLGALAPQVGESARRHGCERDRPDQEQPRDARAAARERSDQRMLALGQGPLLVRSAQ